MTKVGRSDRWIERLAYAYCAFVVLLVVGGAVVILVAL